MWKLERGEFNNGQKVCNGSLFKDPFRNENQFRIKRCWKHLYSRKKKGGKRPLKRCRSTKKKKKVLGRYYLFHCTQEKKYGWGNRLILFNYQWWLLEIEVSRIQKAFKLVFLMLVQSLSNVCCCFFFFFLYRTWDERPGYWLVLTAVHLGFLGVVQEWSLAGIGK